jgi:hypothetical protein
VECHEVDLGTYREVVGLGVSETARAEWEQRGSMDGEWRARSLLGWICKV